MCRWKARHAGCVQKDKCSVLNKRKKRLLLFDIVNTIMESLSRTLALCGVRTDLSFLFSEGNQCIECVNLRLLPKDDDCQLDQNILPIVDSVPVTSDTTTNIYCCYGPRCSTPKKNKPESFWSRRSSKSLKMKSFDKDIHERSAKTDLPAVKGILTLLFCIVCAAVLFTAAAIGSRVMTSLSSSVKSSGCKVHSWESSECKKHQQIRQRTVRFGN